MTTGYPLQRQVPRTPHHIDIVHTETARQWLAMIAALGIAD